MAESCLRAIQIHRDESVHREVKYIVVVSPIFDKREIRFHLGGRGVNEYKKESPSTNSVSPWLGLIYFAQSLYIYVFYSDPRLI